MANRKLLEENTVSKFMKLAKIDSSRSKRFLNEMYRSEEEEGKYPREEEEGGYGSMSLDEFDLDKFLDEANEEEEKKEGGDDAGDEMGELSMTADEAKDIISALEKLLSKLKEAVGSSSEESPEGPEDTQPSSGEGEGEAPEAGDMGAGGTETAGGAAPEELQETLVNKVARRVAARLLRESKKRNRR